MRVLIILLFLCSCSSQYKTFKQMTSEDGCKQVYKGQYRKSIFTK